MEYSKQLLKFRARHNLTQIQLSNILGVNVNMIFRYENGINTPSAMNQIKFENKMKEWEENKNV